jgi:hypothetical protein
MSEITYGSGDAWPYETMVFEDESSIGLYHAPYATKEEARKGHAEVSRAIRLGSEWGGGVDSPYGTPSTTPEQWRTRCGVLMSQTTGANK